MLMHTHEARLDALRKELARAGARRLRDPDLRRAHERIRRRLRPAARLADRVRRLGGDRGGAQGQGGDVRRRALHAAGARPGRRAALRVQVGAADQHRPNGSRENAARGRADRLRPLAAYGSGWAERCARRSQDAAPSWCRSRPTRSTRCGQDRPEPSAAPAFVQDDALAGPLERRQARRGRRMAASAEKLDAAVISALDSVAWLLNIRGADVERTPVALSYVIAHADGTADWFIAPGKVPPEVAAHLGNAVRVRPRDDVHRRAGRAGGQARRGRSRARRSRRSSPRSRRPAPRRSRLTDPVVLPKAIKNPAEQAGHRAAQARDGAAVARFLHWLSVEGAEGRGRRAVRRRAAAAVPRGHRRLARPVVRHDQRRRAERRDRRTTGSSEETNRRLEPGSVYLVDSGGQYPDGTTDITRTVWIGPGRAAGRGEGPLHPRAQGPHRARRADLPARHRRLAARHARAPVPVAGRARLRPRHRPRRRRFLSVHEGPQRIAKARGGQAGTEQELLAGHDPLERARLLQDRRIRHPHREPGAGRAARDRRARRRLARLRDADAGADRPGAGRPRAAVARRKSRWWNAYHARVREVLAPQLEGEALAWLEEACAPL